MIKKSDKLKRRALSLLIALNLISSLLPNAVTFYSKALGDINVCLRAGFVEVGGNAKITVLDDSGNEIPDADFESADPDIADVDENGIVYGHIIGKTTVTVNVSGHSTTITVPVVGENLLIRNGVNHGRFEADVYHESETPSSEATNFFWFNNYNTSETPNMYSYQQHSLIENVPSYVSESTNILKYTFDSENLDVPRRDIRLSTFTEKGTVGPYNDSKTDHRGGIPVNRNRIYEFTGWLKSENTTKLASDLEILVYYYNNKTFIANSGGTKLLPWSGKSGDVDWSQFVVGARPIDIWDSGYILSANPRITTTMTSKIGDILFADFSFHEVIYDHMDFKLNASGEIAVGETVGSSVVHYTNTGNVISASKNASGAVVPIEVTYNSSDTDVATVSSNGQITRVGEGTATITATATIGGITKSSTVTLDGGPLQLHYNFWKLANNGSQAEGKTPIESVVSFDYTTKGNDLEIWPDSSIKTDPWHYVAKDAGQFSFTHDLSAMTLGSSIGNWGRVKIRVSESGIYQASNITTCWSSGGIVRVYLSPDGVSDPMAPKYSLGSIDSYSATYTPNLEKKLGTCYLAAGDYDLTYELVGKNSAHSGNVYLRFGGFLLNGVTEEPTMDISVEALSEVKQGMTKSVNITSEMSDGSLQDLYHTVITATPRETTIANAVVIVSEDTLSHIIQVTGLKTGATVVDVSVSVAGQLIKELELPVTVTEPGELESVELSVSGTESGRVALKTIRELKLNLKDVDGDEIAPSPENIRFEVVPASKAQVTADGVLHAMETGSAVITAHVTIGGVSKDASVDIEILESGENLIKGPSSSFDGEISESDWAWQCGYEEPASTDGVSQWTVVSEIERGGNTENRALGVVLNPNVQPSEVSPLMLKANESNRIKIEPGRLYELSFWLKIEGLTSPNDNLFNVYVDIYGYDSPTITSATAGNFGRTYNYKNYGNYPDDYEEWKRVILPVSAPTDYDGELWISPRILIRHPNYLNEESTGYGGTYWFDDIEVREVGFDRIEYQVTENLNKFGDKTSVLLTPISTTENFINLHGDSIASITTISSTDNDIVSPGTVSAVTPKEGQYVGTTSNLKQPTFDITMNGKNGNAEIRADIKLGNVTRSAFIPYSFSGLENIIKDVVLSFDAVELNCGQSTKTNLAIVRMDGTLVDVSQVEVYYDSSDTRVAEVDQQGNIYAKRSGEAVITAYVKSDGAVRSGRNTIRIIDASELVSVTLSPARVSVECFRSVPLTVSGLMESGYEANLDNAEIEFEVVESEPEDAVQVSRDGIVTGVSKGTALIRAVVTIGSTTVESAPVEVNVVESMDKENVVVNFRSYQSGNARDATIDNDGWELDLSRSSPYVGGLSLGFRYTGYGIQAQINTPNKPVDSDSLFRVLFKSAGNYSFVFSGGNYSGGALAAIYVDGIYVGEYDFSNGKANVPSGPTVQMNCLYLDAGIHEVLIRSIGSTDETGKGYQQFPGVMSFERIDVLPSVSEVILNSSKTNMSIGEHAVLDAKVMMSNGFPYQFGNLISGEEDFVNNFKITNNNPEIITVDSNGVITAVAEGTATLTLTATVKGDSMTKDIIINVDGETLSYVNARTEKEIVYKGDTCRVITSTFLSDGREFSDSSVAYSYISSDKNIFTVADGIITALNTGSAELTVQASFSGKSAEVTIPINVHPEGFDTVELYAPEQVMKPNSQGIKVEVICLTNLGNELDISNATIEFSSSDTGIVAVDDTGLVTPVGVGTAVIQAEVTIGGIVRSAELFMTVSLGKTRSTFYTEEKVTAARENIKTFDWARKEAEVAVKKADALIGKEEFLWGLIPPQSIPRCNKVGLVLDPMSSNCRYCGTDLQAKYSSYPWVTNPLSNPWKIQCPDCKRWFPSNDFGSYYKLGLDEHGVFNSDLAKQRNSELVSNGKDGYLKNILYPEKGEGWGVDDAYGYRPGNTYENGIEEAHTYIGYYSHYGLWYTTSSNNTGLFKTGLEALTNAYLYTGEKKYGRLGAILIDRIADVYPDYDLSVYPEYSNSHGGYYKGKILGRIWEAINCKVFIYAYDAFFPMMDDPYVIDFLSRKAKQYNMENDKSSPDKIRENCESGILRQIADGCKTGKILGNFGMHQSSMALSAVVLDSMPESREWIDWCLRAPGPNDTETSISGSNILPNVINNISRDGHGIEVSPGYNYSWLNNLLIFADAIAGYGGYEEADLYNNPLVRKMFYSMLPLTIGRSATAQIGDSGGTASVSLTPTLETSIKGFTRNKDVELAQLIYFLNGNSSKNLHADIFTKNPEAIATDVQKIIDTHGEYDFDKSRMLPAYGFAVLRSGSLYESASSADYNDNQCSFYMNFGRTRGHGHSDALNLNILAYGLNIAPDFGYPDSGNSLDPARSQWQVTTLSHNTVVVNESEQQRMTYNGTPLHFDGDSRVRVMDADTPRAYANEIYRRTVVTVEANDEVSYCIDFFRVKGGNDHIYSFHASSDEIFEIEGFNPITQTMGTYAGPEVPWGPNSDCPSGFSWLDNIRKAKYPGTGTFSVGFKIKDFKRTLKQNRDLYLKMTMLNDFNLDEITLARGFAPRRYSYVTFFEYVLARRIGNNLDTLFTTVFEPYDSKRYISSVESATLEVVDGAELFSDKAKAVKVRHEDGRIDYIVYASNGKVTYRVDDTFNFKGFIGVYTMKDGKPILAYMNDSEFIGEFEGVPAITGKINNFTKQLSAENSITVTAQQVVDPEMLAGKFIYINNDGNENAVYEIKSARAGDNNTLILELGNNTLIRSYKNNSDLSDGYIYNIAENQNYRIPLGYSFDSSPVFDEIGERNVDVLSELRIQINAISPVDKELLYSAATLPRGARFDPETKTLIWRPEVNQVGKNHVAIEASDGDSSAILHFYINVLPSTVSSKNTPAGESNGQSGIDNPHPDVPGQITQPPSNEEKFVDLGGFNWALDAINDLTGKGIIKGTSESTFSPGINITRADFTVLIARVFELTADSSNSFEDVPGDSYYATEIAAAKENGIVTGIGNNKFSPMEQISRQDMIVIIMRALEKVGHEFKTINTDILSDFIDAGIIGDYARDAVASFVEAGFIKGDRGKINPLGKATRAEVAVLLHRVMENI